MGKREFLVKVSHPEDPSNYYETIVTDSASEVYDVRSMLKGPQFLEIRLSYEDRIVTITEFHDDQQDYTGTDAVESKIDDILDD